MKLRTAISTMAICCMLLLPALPVRADGEYPLPDGVRGVIAERHLFLIGPDGKRVAARPGSYVTRDGRHLLIVRGNGTEVREIRTAPR
jgi:hypothetical protein